MLDVVRGEPPPTLPGSADRYMPAASPIRIDFCAVAFPKLVILQIEPCCVFIDPVRDGLPIEMLLHPQA